MQSEQSDLFVLTHRLNWVFSGHKIHLDGFGMIWFKFGYLLLWACSGSVVECLTRNRRVAGFSRTVVTALCHCARQINPCLVQVQPRKTRPDITEFFLTGT